MRAAVAARWSCSSRSRCVAAGLLLGGQLVQVPGVNVLAPASVGGPPRCRMHPATTVRGRGRRSS